MLAPVSHGASGDDFLECIVYLRLLLQLIVLLLLLNVIYHMESVWLKEDRIKCKNDIQNHSDDPMQNFEKEKEKKI